MRHCTTGIKTLVDSNHVHLIPWAWTLIFKRDSTPRVPTTTPQHETTSPRNEECSSLFQRNTPHLSDLSSLARLHSSHNCRNNSFLVPLTFSAHTAHICTTWMKLTMTNFYRRSSNCQPHHTVHLSVVSTTVLTITTAHSTASSTTVLLAHHFLCPAIVRARLSLSLPYITINY